MYSYRSLLSPKLKTFLRLESFRKSRTKKRPLLLARSVDYINVPKYRISITKIRASSHDLEIERGRYTRPKTDPNQRLCSWCFEIEDEEHFITKCQINAHERQNLYVKIVSKHPTFRNLSNHEQFIFLMSCKDRQILTWLGKFIHKSFNIRNTKRHKSCIPSQQYHFPHVTIGD